MKNKFNRALSMLLAILCAFSLCVTATGISYDDVDGHWAEDAIERFTGYGIVNGEGTSFNPDGALTRAMMATILSRALGLTETAENPFADVAEDAWYTEHVLKCYKAGIMLGDGKNANPEALISREEAMVMLCRALGIKPDDNADLSAFEDSESVSDWAVPYVSALINKGIVGGVAEGILSPDGDMSRGAMLTVLDRAVVQYINEPGEYTLENKEGIILVASNDVTLTGTTSADLIIAQGADGGKVTFNEATVTGEVTVKAEDTNIVKNNSEIGDVEVSGDSTVTEEETETPEDTQQTVPTGHSHDWDSWKNDGETHTRVCRKNPDHVETENHVWNGGEVTTPPTYEEEGVKTFACVSCGAEYTEAVDKLVPVDKKGYDVVFTLESNILSFTLTTPESDTAPLHEVVFTDGNGNFLMSHTSEFHTPVEMILSANTYEKVIIKTLEEFGQEGTVVAEWPLEKKLVCTIDQFTVVSDGITLTKKAYDIPESSIYTFSGLDTESYSYIVNNRNMRDFIDNEPFIAQSSALDYENGVAQLYAYTVEETATAYNIKRSNLFTVTATEVEPEEPDQPDIPDEPDEPETPDQTPLGFELTKNIHDAFYVSVLVPEDTTGIISYKVEIFDGDELLATAEAHVNDNMANIDPRLLVDGVNTVKITSMDGNGEIASYTGAFNVEVYPTESVINTKYENDILYVELPADFKGLARPEFYTDSSDAQGTVLASQFFNAEATYKWVNLSKTALEADVVTALEGKNGLVKLSGWSIKGIEDNTLSVTVYESEPTAVTFAPDPEVEDVDSTALGVVIEEQNIYYKLTVINPDVPPRRYEINIYNSNTNLGINMECNASNPTVYFDPVNISKYQELPDTVDVISYDYDGNEAGKLTYALGLAFSTSDFVITPVYDKSTGDMTITFPEIVTALLHGTYKANLGDEETDLSYEALENASSTVWSKPYEPLSLIIDSVESVGGYISLSGWNSNSVSVDDTSIDLYFDVYNGVYSKITVNEGSGSGNEGDDIESDENELPLDPDSITDLSVKNIRFESESDRIWLKWDVAVAENDRVEYGVYGKRESDSEWTLITNTSQNLISPYDSSLDGIYQLKIVTKLDDEISAEAVAEGLTLTACKSVVENPAEVTFEEVTEEKEGTYRISVKGLNPYGYYYVYVKESLTSGGMSGFGGTLDGNGDHVAGENDKSWGSNLKTRVENGYYLVYDFSGFTLSQDGKALTYTCTQYGDWTKCTPNADPDAPADENETDKDNWN